MKYSYMLLLTLNTLTITQTSLGAALPQEEGRGSPICIRVRPRAAINRISMESDISTESSTTVSQMRRSSALSLSSVSTLESEESQAAAPVESSKERRAQAPAPRAQDAEEHTAAAPGTSAAVAPAETLDDHPEARRPTIRQRVRNFLRETVTFRNIVMILINIGGWGLRFIL